MERWKEVSLSKEEEEGITVEDDELFSDEIFRHTLVSKLWTDNSYNVRAFKQTMTQAWRHKNPIEIQDLNKNLFLFRFSSKRDAENVSRNGPWSFDRNLLILERVTGEERSSDLEMYHVSFWVRVYDLPLKLRSDSMAKKLVDIVGKFEEADLKDSNRLGRSLRVKVAIDIRKPLKRGTVVRYQGRDLRVYFKYERLPNFCFVCGRIGHQMEDREEVEASEEEGYEELEEKDLSFGPWLRASPLPKTTTEHQKESSSGTCSKNLLASTSNSKLEPSAGGRETETEVEQRKDLANKGEIVTTVQ